MKALIWIVVVILVAWGVYAWMGSEKNVIEVKKKITTTTPVMEDGTIEAKLPTPKTVTVNFTSDGYVPAEVTINEGDTVKFMNQSNINMWPASAMHPTHENYDGTSLSEHCKQTINLSFDACKNIPVGWTYLFTFDKAGTWKYHDHLNPKFSGSVIVK